MKLSRLVPIPMLALVAACAHTPPPELADARAAYDRAEHGLAAQLAPADVHVARRQLDLAEESWNDRGDTYETRSLAYAATRKARLAEVHAHTRAARQQETEAQAEIDRLRDEQVRTTSAQLSTAQQQIVQQQEQLKAAQEQRDMADQQRIAAEKRAQQAQADLARIGSVRQEQRGMVITLSGSVLFVSGKADLLPEAIARLNEVAQVLGRQDKDSKIVVQGFTDSQGGETFNLELSRRRADAVRDFLVSHGIAADRITSEGYGEARPIASNATPEGRANNRRVEIVVQPR